MRNGIDARSALYRLKPASSVRARLLLAALIWTFVGGALFVLGVRWTLAEGGWLGWVVLAIAGLVGWVKSRYVLTQRAAVNARRIVEAGEGRCLGGVFAWTTWGLVAGMVLFGSLLRHSGLPPVWLGLIYSAVGIALLAASRISWRQWSQLGPRGSPRV